MQAAMVALCVGNKFNLIVIHVTRAPTLLLSYIIYFICRNFVSTY